MCIRSVYYFFPETVCLCFLRDTKNWDEWRIVNLRSQFFKKKNNGMHQRFLKSKHENRKQVCVCFWRRKNKVKSVACLECVSLFSYILWSTKSTPLKICIKNNQFLVTFKLILCCLFKAFFKWQKTINLKKESKSLSLKLLFQIKNGY